MSGHDLATRDLAATRILILNWRDNRHPQAGGAEQYMYEIARRWVAAGAVVTWFSATVEGRPGKEVTGGIRFIRSGGDLTVYLKAAAYLVRASDEFDIVVDCQNGIPFFSPIFARSGTPIVQVIHHVHQDQFATRFSAPLATLGRLLEGPMARRVYGPRAIAAVSPSTRLEVRTRLRFPAPIFVVPNGSIDVPAMTGPRDPHPTVAVVSRLVPHKRLDLLLGEIAVATRQIPNLRVDLVGDGAERSRLEGLVTDLGLRDTVTVHGYLPAAERDALLSRAWLTASTSAAEGWGCSIIEAAAWGIPCLALRVPGIRDAVLHGSTGWLVDRPEQFAPTLVSVLAELADEERAREVAEACQAWARCFTWDRTADLLAGVLLAETRAPSVNRRAERRIARADIATLATFATPEGDELRSRLRATDQISRHGADTVLLLNGCDEFDAATLLRRLGIVDAEIRLADRHDLLAGPSADAASVGRP